MNQTKQVIAELENAGIPFEKGDAGAKRYLKVKLTNGGIALICGFNKTVKVGIKGSVKFKNLDKFLELRGLEIKR